MSQIWATCAFCASQWYINCDLLRWIMGYASFGLDRRREHDLGRHSWWYVCACVCICACMCECHRQVQSEIAHSIRAALIRKASTSCLAAKLCWWGTRGETVGNVWDTEARHSHGQYDLDSSWRVARMRPHREEGEKLHLQRPQVQPTQVLENPKELRQPAQPDLSVKKEREIKKPTMHKWQMQSCIYKIISSKVQSGSFLCCSLIPFIMLSF